MTAYERASLINGSGCVHSYVLDGVKYVYSTQVSGFNRKEGYEEMPAFIDGKDYDVDDDYDAMVCSYRIGDPRKDFVKAIA